MSHNHKHHKHLPHDPLKTNTDVFHHPQSQSVFHGINPMKVTTFAPVAASLTTTMSSTSPDTVLAGNLKFSTLDTGIIFPDGTKQITAAGTSGGGGSSISTNPVVDSIQFTADKSKLTTSSNLVITNSATKQTITGDTAFSKPLNVSSVIFPDGQVQTTAFTGGGGSSISTDPLQVKSILFTADNSKLTTSSNLVTTNNPNTQTITADTVFSKPLHISSLIFPNGETQSVPYTGGASISTNPLEVESIQFSSDKSTLNTSAHLVTTNGNPNFTSNINVSNDATIVLAEGSGIRFADGTYVTSADSSKIFDPTQYVNVTSNQTGIKGYKGFENISLTPTIAESHDYHLGTSNNVTAYYSQGDYIGAKQWDLQYSGASYSTLGYDKDKGILTMGGDGYYQINATLTFPSNQLPSVPYTIELHAGNNLFSFTVTEASQVWKVSKCYATLVQTDQVYLLIKQLVEGQKLNLLMSDSSMSLTLDSDLNAIGLNCQGSAYVKGNIEVDGVVALHGTTTMNGTTTMTGNTVLLGNVYYNLPINYSFQTDDTYCVAAVGHLKGPNTEFVQASTDANNWRMVRLNISQSMTFIISATRDASTFYNYTIVFAATNPSQSSFSGYSTYGNVNVIIDGNGVSIGNTAPSSVVRCFLISLF